MEGSMAPAKLLPALLAGVAIGVLSALPVINMANFCCCAWVLFGGALASYLMQQNHPAPITAGDGAIVGLLAGVVGAIVGTLISIPLTIAMGPFQAQLIERLLEGARDMPPEARNILEGMRTGPALGIGLIFSFFAMLAAGCVFGLIGGLVGALLFRRDARTLPPPPPPPVPTF
jgi:uncharacterized membrane protein YeaQ/YmgE (transglycosylase-associated protein family)